MTKMKEAALGGKKRGIGQLIEEGASKQDNDVTTEVGETKNEAEVSSEVGY